MTRALVLSILFTFLSSPSVFADDPLPEHARASIKMSARWSSSHACAVDGVVITNAHVVDRRLPTNMGDPIVPATFRYQQVDGPEGIGELFAIIGSADIALVNLDQYPTYFAPRATEAPAEGDEVSWYEYDLRKNEDAYKRRRRTTRVVTDFAGTLVLKDKATTGASGGCLFNEVGEVVGLMTFQIPTDDGKRGTGIAGIWAHWFDSVVVAARARQ